MYRPGEVVRGTVSILAKDGWGHDGVTLKASGEVQMKLSARSVGLFESMTNVKPVVLFESQSKICGPAKVPHGVTTIPFELRLEVRKETNPTSPGLLESYHGVYINVTYTLWAECSRGVMKKPLTCDMEFIVEAPSADGAALARLPPPAPKTFTITPESLENVQSASLAGIPKFKITGSLSRDVCPINLPFTGEVVVESSETPIKSIEVMLVGVESVAHPSKPGAEKQMAKEASEIQSIQIADGDVCRNLVVPIFFFFPRLFTCPTLDSIKDDQFRVDFELNLIVIFEAGYVVTECFPIRTTRT